MATSKPALVRQWAASNKEYRLLKREHADYYHSTAYTVEVDEKDSLGAPKWMSVYEWSSRSDVGGPSERALNAIAVLVDTLVKAEAAAAPKPSLLNGLPGFDPSTYTEKVVVQPTTWKIARKSNFDHEDWRGDQYFVAENIKHERQAKIMAEALNDDQGLHGDDFFEVVPDDYVLPPKWEP